MGKNIHAMRCTMGNWAKYWAVLWAAGLIFITAGYFQNNRPGWNVNSQFDLALAIAERGTFAIDAYHDRTDQADKVSLETGDKAFFRGHYYSDKSPVTAFLGVPMVWLYRQGADAFGLRFSYGTARYLATWGAVGLAAAVLAGLVTMLLLRHRVEPGRAAMAGALWVAATPMLGYSILFFNYLPACTLALGGYLMIEPAVEDEERVSLWRLGAGGLLLGLAAWTLNTMALIALGLTFLLLIAPLTKGGERSKLKSVWRLLWPWAVGGLLGIAGYFIYNYAIFHSFDSPYLYEVNTFFRDQMAKGLMGATRPNPLVAWLITFHPYHGLFYWFPFTLAALLGLVWMLIRGKRPARLESTLALLVLAGFIVYNSAYFMWWGGWCYAPRHLIPALSLLAIGLVPWLAGKSLWPGRILLLVGLAGAVMNIAAVAVDPQPPSDLHWPRDPVRYTLSEEMLRNPAIVQHWLNPWLSLQKYFWIGKAVGPNWGTALGLRGPTSLVPLAILWLVALVAAGRLTQNGKDSAFQANEPETAAERDLVEEERR